MLEGLKSALGLSTSAPNSIGASDVDPLTHQMLHDLNLPDPAPQDAAQPIADHHDLLEEAREVVSDWLNEGHDIEQPLRIVFEALFGSDAQAAAYLASVKTLALDGFEYTATRPFVDSTAAAVVVTMIAAPEEIVRVEQTLAPCAQNAGGKVDGYYLEGHASGD